MTARIGVSKESVRRAFGRNAGGYDAVAGLQREMGRYLLEQLGKISLNPHVVLDLGCGTGWAAQNLISRFPSAQVVGMDFAFAMLQLAQRRNPVLACLCGDIERLPLKQGAVDIIYSNAALQWCNDVRTVLRALRPALAPGGWLLFSTFGPDTLKELRLAWSDADGYAHVSSFSSSEELQGWLEQAGFVAITLERRYWSVAYAEVRDLMMDLKLLGASNAAYGRAKGLTGKGRLAAMLRAYENLRVDGYLPVTYELLYGLARNT